MQGRTWKNVQNGTGEKVKSYLLENGGLQEEIKSPHEGWRVKFSDSTFTYYRKGTVFIRRVFLVYEACSQPITKDAKLAIINGANLFNEEIIIDGFWAFLLASLCV